MRRGPGNGRKSSGSLYRALTYPELQPPRLLNPISNGESYIVNTQRSMYLPQPHVNEWSADGDEMILMIIIMMMKTQLISLTT